MLDPLLEQIAGDVKEVRQNLIELLQNQATSHQMLVDHKQRITDLENRLTPVESDRNFLRKIAFLLTTSGGISIVVAMIKIAIAK
jgi:hypothetical protein